MNANHYESLIDRAPFDQIAGYLHSDSYPIYFLLHVKQRQDLANIADMLDRVPFESSSLIPGLPKFADQMLRDGSLKVSSRFRLPQVDRTWGVDPKRVRQETNCEVIYAEPYYLVHTPGLFEGKVLQPSKLEQFRDELSKLKSGDKDPQKRIKSHERER